MLPSAARLFADLAVGKKLLCGFSLVLLLTVVVAGSGFLAVESVLQGHGQASRLALVGAQILQAQRLERDFAVSQTTQSAEQMRVRLGAARELLAEQIQHTGAANRGRLQTMDQAMLDYRLQFDSYVELQGKAREARQDMRHAAGEARDQFETVELDMYDAVRELRLQGDKLRGSDPLILAETASSLNKRMLELRGFESQYIIDGSAEALEEWNYIGEDLHKVASSLSVWLDDEQKGAIAAALQALTLYQRSFGYYQQIREQARVTETAMIERARGGEPGRGGPGA